MELPIVRLNMGPPVMDERVVITWDKPMRERLRKAYKKAERGHQSAFIFEGNQYLTTYAKYLLEYLDMQMEG